MQMGWFRNSNNTERAFNNIILDAYGQKLGEKLALLQQHKETASTASSAIDTLLSMGAVKHPTLTATAGQVCEALLKAQTEVTAHLDEIGLMMLGTQLEMVATLSMIENYSVPRIHRQVNLSGLDMASLATKGLEELRVEIPRLNQTHDALISKTQQTTQNAYRVLNTN
jgi:hypothetical protein